MTTPKTDAEALERVVRGMLATGARATVIYNGEEEIDLTGFSADEILAELRQCDEEWLTFVSDDPKASPITVFLVYDGDSSPCDLVCDVSSHDLDHNPLADALDAITGEW